MMARTFFTEWRRGDEILFIEYSRKAGTLTTYSPMYGAESGDPEEIDIISVKNDADQTVTLTADEYEKLETWIFETVPFEPDDWDDWF